MVTWNLLELRSPGRKAYELLVCTVVIAFAFIESCDLIHFLTGEFEVKYVQIVFDVIHSHIYLICRRDDALAAKNLVTESDLYGRTLMIGGGSPAALRTVQQRIISSGKVKYFNSADHDTTYVNIAAKRGVCLAPGFLNDHSGQLAWIPFECKETFSCQLVTHKTDKRESLSHFISIMKKLYSEAVAVPL